MELKYVVPNMAQTFGNLEFAGENRTEHQRINGRYSPVSRSFNLYSDVQRADEKSILSQNSEYSLSIQRLPLTVKMSKDEASQIIS